MQQKCDCNSAQNFKCRLLAIDIDGTLVNSCDELTADTREALIRAGRAGIQVVLATGRRYSHSLHLVDPLGIDVPLITASGALIKDPKDHRTLYKSSFEPQLLGRILKLIDQSGYDPLLCADTFTEGFDYYLAQAKVRTTELAEYLEMNPNGGRIVPDLITDPPPGAFLVFTFGTKEQMLAMDQILHAELPGQSSSHVLRSPRYRGFLIEIAPAGVSKWSGVKHLAEEWGIDESEICAVGDDVNDIPMIRAAGLGVAMGNALAEVKAAADRIAPTHDENGLVTVVEWLL
jgi:5-amino-6-(5-phospho-D-ribitylamino)uracil phosphatase